VRPKADGLAHEQDENHGVELAGAGTRGSRGSGEAA
jgi:hypothetical protein